MPDNVKISEAILKSLQDAVKGFRPTLRRETDLSAQDVSALAIEPILAALGWDMKDPRTVRRPDQAATLRLLSSGNTALTVRAIAAAETLPEKVPADLSADGDWIALSNGLDWAVFNRHNPERAFRTASLKTAATIRDTASALGMIAKAAFQKDALAEAWMSEAVDGDVKRALAAHLDASDDLVSSLQARLASQGRNIAPESIRSALARIPVALDVDTAPEMTEVATPATAPAPASATEKTEEPKAEKPAAKRGRPAKKAAAKTDTKEAGPKAATTKAATKTKAKPVEPAPAEAATAAEVETPAAVTTAEAPAEEKPAATAPKPASKARTKSGGKKTSSKKRRAPRKPEGTTHTMLRKESIGFIKIEAGSEEVTLLPGSKLTQTIGKALTAPYVRAREEALQNGQLVKKGSLLQVMEPMSFQSPRAAATFVAGTLVKDIAAWRDADGNPLAEVQATEEKQAETV